MILNSLHYHRKLIETAEKLVESLHQIARRKLLGKWSKVHDVGIQNRHVIVSLNVHFVEARLRLTARLTLVHFQHNAALNLRRYVGRDDAQQKLLLLLTFTFELHPMLDSGARSIDSVDVCGVRHDPVV